MVRQQRDQGISAYTQTFTTADRTVANATATTVTIDVQEENGGGVWGSDTEAEFDSLITSNNALIVDVDDLRQTVTALIDDLQEAGVVR